MSRGRHRQTPPLHRLLSPVTIAVAALACAGGAWLVEGDVTDTGSLLLRGLAAGAAAAAVVGAVLLRRWDRDAGRRVGELKAARARDGWKSEERTAELETELEQARELRAAVETRLRQKRAELARLRTEHAALLRRYATAETERASALEGRRLLAIEAAEPTKALPATVTDHRSASGAPTALTYRQAEEALERLSRNAARQRETRELQARVEEARQLEAQAERDRAERERAAQERAERERAERGRAGRDGTGGATAPSVGRAGAPATAGPRHGAPASDQTPPGGFDFFGTQQGPPSRAEQAERPQQPERPEQPERGGPDERNEQGDGDDRDGRGPSGGTWAPAGRTPAGPSGSDRPRREAPAPAVPRPAAGKVIDLGTHGGPGGPGDDASAAASGDGTTVDPQGDRAADEAADAERTGRRVPTGRRRGSGDGDASATRRIAALRRAIS